MNTILQTRETELPRTSNERVLDIVLKEDDLNWKDLIHGLVREENMDPWDIDLSILAEKFLEMLSTLKNMDFRIGGKMVLTSSILLKMKSDHLMNDGFTAFDNLINGPEELQEDFLDDDSFEFEQTDIKQFLNGEQQLVPRTPQPRERKVSVFDLVDALENALDVDMRRRLNLSRRPEEEPLRAEGKAPFDLGAKMSAMNKQLANMFTKKETKIFFTDLLAEQTSKIDLVYTFLPLLHLENQQKVELLQKEHFGPIQITIFNRTL
jgi:segregation and condensation protein A